jgi:hypothetical protein
VSDEGKMIDKFDTIPNTCCRKSAEASTFFKKTAAIASYILEHLKVKKWL